MHHQAVRYMLVTRKTKLQNLFCWFSHNHPHHHATVSDCGIFWLIPKSITWPILWLRDFRTENIIFIVLCAASLSRISTNLLSIYVLGSRCWGMFVHKLFCTETNHCQNPLCTVKVTYLHWQIENKSVKSHGTNYQLNLLYACTACLVVIKAN